MRVKKLYIYQCKNCYYRWQVNSHSKPQNNQCMNCTKYVKPVLRTEKDRRMFGLYTCWNCTRTWESANSWFDYPQKCKKCASDVYPYSQDEIDKEIYGYYECECGEAWESESWENYPEICYCGNEVYPYQVEEGYWKQYGYYECECGNMWESENAEENYPKECYQCENEVYPYLLEDLELFSHIDQTIPHPIHLCGKCKALKGSCVNGVAHLNKKKKH